MMAPKYMELDKPIIDELTRQGHKIACIEDKMLDFDFHHPWRGWHDRTLQALRCWLKQSFRRYWSERIETDSRLNETYDLFLCINGCSFHPYLMNHLLKKSPRLRRILYLWDNSSFYDYFHNAACFDRVVTYDLDDSIKFGAEFLPFYWYATNSEHGGGNIA